jgi:hypothetical protein
MMHVCSYTHHHIRTYTHTHTNKHTYARTQVVLPLASATALPEAGGSIYVPTFPEDALLDALDVLDLDETPLVEPHARRWANACVATDTRASSDEQGRLGRGVDGAPVMHAIECRAVINIPRGNNVQLTLGRRRAPNIPALFLLYKVVVGSAQEAKKEEKGEEDGEVAEWSQVVLRIEGKAWWSRAKLLHKMCKHASFVNSLSILPAVDATQPARVFSADGKGVIRAWSASSPAIPRTHLLPVPRSLEPHLSSLTHDFADNASPATPPPMLPPPTCPLAHSLSLPLAKGKARRMHNVNACSHVARRRRSAQVADSRRQGSGWHRAQQICRRDNHDVARRCTGKQRR